MKKEELESLPRVEISRFYSFIYKNVIVSLRIFMQVTAFTIEIKKIENIITSS